MPLLKRLLNTGITPEMSFYVCRKIYVINLAGLMGGTSSILFLIFNLFSKNYILVSLDAVTLIAGYSIIYFNHKKMTSYPAVIVGLIYSICSSASAVLYHNNMEFFLLLFIGVYFILLENVVIITVFSLLNAALFLLIYLNPNYYDLVEPVSKNYRFIVLFNCFALYLFFLYFFKKQNALYQSRIESQNTKLTAINANKEKMFAMIAHDIRGPIASTASILQLAREEMLTQDEFADLAERLSADVAGLQENIDSLLIWGKSQFNGIESEPVLFFVRNAIQKLAADFKVISNQKSITINVEEVNELQVFADPNQFELVIRNLLSNAIKFSPQGGTIDITTAAAGNFTAISIADSGSGLSPEKIHNILNLQNISSTDGTSMEKGTGLGLKFSLEFLEKNGGSLSINSVEGKGSIFTANFPNRNRIF
ncbi:two-component system sensor histidine kinase/response regulator [Pedobacter sp. UYP24]